MVRLFTFSRSKKTDKKVSRTDKDEDVADFDPFDEEQKKMHRFKRPTEVLKKMNVSLMSKMEELRVLPVSYSHDHIGSFFYDELEFFNTTESSNNFKYFYLGVVDKSQSLPIILLNKQFLLTQLLDKYPDPYFQPICSRLIIALVRDCGQEISELFTEQVIPKIASTIKVVDVASVEAGFRVFASALKFLMKDILKNPVKFVRSFLSSTIRIKNAFIRKFTTECVAFIIGRIRHKDELNKTVSGIFYFTLEDLEIEDNGAVMVQNFDDFKATLLFMVLRGDHGAISHAGLDLIEFIGELLASKDIETAFFKKTFNLLIENEFRFFKERKNNEPIKIGHVTYLEDYLTSLYEHNPKSSTLACNLLAILTEVILFNSGQRFDSKFIDLSEKLVKRSNPDMFEQGLIFLAKFTLVKRQEHPLSQLLGDSNLEIDHYWCFLNNLFKKSTFKRVLIHTAFKKTELEVAEEISCPILDQAPLESILLILMKGISAALSDAENYRCSSDILLLTACLLENNLNGQQIRLDEETYLAAKKLLSHYQLVQSLNSVGESDSQAILILSTLRLLRMTQNFSQDKEIGQKLIKLLEKLRNDFTNEDKLLDMKDEHIEIENEGSEEYLMSFKPQSFNYSLNCRLEGLVLYLCEFVQSVLHTPTAGSQEVQVCYDTALELLSLKDNFTSVIQTFVLVRKAAIAVSKRISSPGLMCISQEGQTTFSFNIEQRLKTRIMKYLWSEVPNCRINSLKLLLPQKSQLLTQLIELDTDEIAFYKERELFLLSSQIANNVYYKQYSDEECLVLFHFILGFSSFRITTLQAPLNQALSYILLRMPELFNVYQDHIIIASQLSLEEKNHNEGRLGKLWSGVVDPVTFQVWNLRILESLERVLSERGAASRFQEDRNTTIKGQKQEKKKESEESSGPNEMDESKLKENNRRLAVIYRVMEKLLQKDLVGDAIPSLELVIGQGTALKSINRSYSIEEIATRFRRTIEEDSANDLLRKRKANSFEKLKRILRGIKGCFGLSGFSEREILSKYLLELMKYPNEELQSLGLQVLLKIQKQNRIVKQHSQLLTDLTAKDNFKDNLTKMSEKLSSLSEMERDQLLPILNSLLYRRLIDKTGLPNKKRFKAQREYIFDKAASFSEKEIQSLINTIFLTHGLPKDTHENYSRILSSSSKLSLSKLLQFTDLCETLLNRLGPSMSHSNLLDLVERMGEIVELSERMATYLKSEKVRLDTLLKQIKERRLAEQTENLEIDDEQEDKKDGKLQEPMNEEIIPQENDEEVENELSEGEEDDEKEADANFSPEDDLLNETDKVSLILLKQVKQLKQTSFKRVVQILSNFIELDYSLFYEKFIPVIKQSIQNLSTKTLMKTPTTFRLLGLWSECELYKKYFIKYPVCLDGLVSLIGNDAATARLYTDTFDALLRLASYNLTQENEDEFDMGKVAHEYLGDPTPKILMKDHLTNQEEEFSAIGVHLIKSSADQIVRNLALLSERLDNNQLRLVRASDLKNLRKRVSEFSLFISAFCTEGDSTSMFYEVTKKAWSVEQINKKTSKPYHKIDSAQELNAVQKEREVATNMIKILGNFAAQLENIEELFALYFLPLVARLDDLKLRIHLSEIYSKICQNPNFSKLQMDNSFLAKLSALHQLAGGLSRTSLDYSKIVDFLMDISGKLDTLTTNEQRILVANCLFWLTSDEMSTREKSLSIVSKYIQEVDLGVVDELIGIKAVPKNPGSYSNLFFYRSIVLDTVSHFLQSHFSREHVMRYFCSILRFHCVKCIDQNLSDVIEYGDLSLLVDQNNIEQDFFEMIFNIKLPLRGQAIKTLKKVIKKGQSCFRPSTIRNIFAKIFDYYLHEYWQEATNSKNAYSATRIDSVRHLLEKVFEVYGMMVGQLPFGNFVRFVKDKMYQLTGKSEKYQETNIKIVCSCLSHLNTHLPNVLDKIQTEQRILNEQQMKKSLVNKFLEAYSSTSQVTEIRMNYDLDLPEKKSGTTLALEMAELKEDAATYNQEPAMLDEIDEEEEEQKAQAVLSDSQYRTLKLHILAPLKRHLFKADEKEPTKHTVRSEVAMAIIQIIKLFPQKVFTSELIGTISKICSILIDRDENRRKSARSTISTMQKLLGPFFFGYFVKELSFHLKRGREVHIRNYMIFKLLETLIKPTQGDPIKCGQIDYAIPLVAPLLVDEYCGDLEAEKEVEEIKNKSVEFRKNKAAECFKMIVQKIDFKGEALTQIVNSFRESFLNSSQLHKVDSAKHRCSVK